jgi:DNA invertase Pin-like site-specific DNA recombinase
VRLVIPTNHRSAASCSRHTKRAETPAATAFVALDARCRPRLESFGTHPNRTPEPATVIVAYTRVSVEDTTDTNSLSLQESRIRALAELHGRTISDVFTDNGVSGARKNRPALDRLLALVRQRKVHAVYGTALDRLSRKLAHLVELIDLFQRHGVALVSLREGVDTGTAVGRLISNVLGSVAEFERESIRARMREASGERLRRGLKHCVRVPYGYREVPGNRFMPHDSEQPSSLRCATFAAERSPTHTLASQPPSTNAPSVRDRVAGATPRRCATSSRPRSRPEPRLACDPSRELLRVRNDRGRGLLDAQAAEPRCS